MLQRNSLICTLLFFCLLCVTSLAHAAGVAKVIAVTGGVSLERGGQSQPLALKADLEVQDIIRTDATGKVQFMFHDDTTVTVGVNSQFAMEEYNNSGVKSFKSNVAVGFARFVTGAIVENNPEAFSVRTPQATVGIRGTTFSVSTRGNITSVFTESSLNAQSVMVKDVIIAPGHMATFGPQDKVLTGPMPMTPAQREELVEKSRIGNPVAGIGLGGVVQPFLQERELGINDSVENTLSDARHDDLSENPLDSSFVKDVHAVANGSFELASRNGGPDSEGVFSFDANLSTGNLSNANFSTTDATGGDFSVTGGTGSANADGFTLGGGTATMNGGAAAWGVTSDDSLGSDDDFEGDLTISVPGGAMYDGEIEGQLQQK